MPNPRDKHAGQKKKKNSNCVTFLCTCCLFWFIISGLLVTALVFIGRHLVTSSMTPGYFYWMSKPISEVNVTEKTYHRLSRDIRPISYNLTLLPYLDKNYFEGFVNITLKIHHPQSEIVLNSKGQSMFSVVLTQPNRTYDILSVTENMKFEVLIIKPKEKLFPGNFTLAIKFRGMLEKTLGGLYKSTYRNGNKTRYNVLNVYRKSSPTFISLRQLRTASLLLVPKKNH